MTEVFVLGFPRSTYVHIVRLILTHKGVSYTFRDLEPELGSASHLALHPFDRVPILQHGDLTVYETSAIATYVDEAFEGPALQPKDVRARARMNQWISSVNSYYYPYMIYHVTHERLVYPQLGIASDEKVVAGPARARRLGEGAWPRDRLHPRQRSQARRFLHAAEHVCFRADRRRKGDVSEISFGLRLARAHGSTAGRQAFSRRPSAARSDRACPQMGCFAPSEILTHARGPLRPCGAVATSRPRQSPEIALRVAHARGSSDHRRRNQAVHRAAEEASLTSTRRARGFPNSTSRRKTPRCGTISSAPSA